MSLGTLHVVATPIGNLEDITLRALRILGEVAVIACEDTRITKRLLAHHQITTPTISLHQHSGDRAYQRIIDVLARGQSVAYVSDAGTPGVADPGNLLVAAVNAVGAPIVPIPGASAVTALLSVAGMATDRYHFYGFIPHKKGRQTMLQQIIGSDVVSVFFESTHRLHKTLEALIAAGAGDRHVVIGRELTKVFEEVYRGTVHQALQYYMQAPAKGEFVFLIAPR